MIKPLAGVSVRLYKSSYLSSAFRTLYFVNIGVPVINTEALWSIVISSMYVNTYLSVNALSYIIYRIR